jgi:hypothetical protein
MGINIVSTEGQNNSYPKYYEFEMTLISRNL